MSEIITSCICISLGYSGNIHKRCRNKPYLSFCMYVRLSVSLARGRVFVNL